MLDGCFDALATLGVGLFAPMGVGAQSYNQDAVFGKITCTEIEVVDPSGKLRCSITSDKHGGYVGVLGEGGREATMDK